MTSQETDDDDVEQVDNVLTEKLGGQQLLSAFPTVCLTRFS